MQSQKGSTLIVVLILLLLITIIGSLAIRSSIVSLNIATNSQAQQLLIQNSDAAIFNVENPSALIRNMALDGMFGFIKGDANKGKELVFCYRGDQAQFFNLSLASLIMWESGQPKPTNNSFGITGYCHLDSAANSFTSGRRAVMTQVAIKMASVSAQGTPFEYMPIGTDLESSKLGGTEWVLVYATSIFPDLGPQIDSSMDASINNCFAEHMNQVVVPAGTTPNPLTASQSVAECLQALGVPTNTQIAEYSLAQAFNAN